MIAKVSRKTSMMGLFSKVVCVQCPGCYSSLKRLNHIFFPEYISKSGRFKKNVFRKKAMVGHGFGQGPGVQSPQYQKTELMLDPVHSTSWKIESAFCLYFQNGLELLD